MSKSVIIVDLDGTLCDITHRLHHIHGDKKDWDAFVKACPDDVPKYDIIDMVNELESEYFIVIVSGRSDTVRAETEMWLRSNRVGYDGLVMRKQGDFTPDDKLKKQWLYDGTISDAVPWDKVTKENLKDEVLLTLDDRQRVVDMWRAEGLTCLQVDAWEETK